jgi:hypothetical protein
MDQIKSRESLERREGSTVPAFVLVQHIHQCRSFFSALFPAGHEKLLRVLNAAGA